MVTKATKKVETAFTLDAEGNIVIHTKAAAITALVRAGMLDDRIKDVERSIYAEKKELVQLRRALAKYQEQEEVLEIQAGEYKSNLVERTDKTWIWDDDDMEIVPERNTEVQPLLRILKKIGNVQKRKAIIGQITRTVLDPGLLDDAVKRGLIKAEMIAPAFYEYVSTTYVQIKRVK